jgi:hypothetical protein
MPLLAALDAVLAAAIALVAAAWLVRRLLRALRPGATGGACGCGGSRACGPRGDAALLRAAAARSAGANRAGGHGAG